MAPPPEPRVEVSDLSKGDIRNAVRDPGAEAIARVMPTILIKPLAVDSVTPITEAWGVKAVRADTSSRTGEGVVVAVLDTGIDGSHTAFVGLELVEEDFTGSGGGDQQGHGTHCAGTIFGRNVNGTRIGVAPGVTCALIGKVLDQNGRGTSEMIFNAIEWAARLRAHVVSISLGFDFPGSVECMRAAGWPVEMATSIALETYRDNLRMFDALMQMTVARAAFGEGTVVVAAAGNESRRDQRPDFEIGASLPAAAQGIISVGALGRVGDRLGIAPFSNTYPRVSAPGVGILSAKRGGGLVTLSGTSMACPHAAGVACLWWEELRKSGNVKPNASLVATKLLATARTGVFVPGMDQDDRGVGIVTAPL
jgi:subtilisin family serine protease